MELLVIDAQGGGIGKQVVAAIKKTYPALSVTAVGTNSLATSAMLKAGADNGATGENSVVVCAAKADFIIGPVGIVIADSLLGEITPRMAVAVGKSKAVKYLIPVNQYNNYVVGASDLTISKMVNGVITELTKFLAHVNLEIDK